MARGTVVPRPTRKTEYRIVFEDRSAAVGWQNLIATTTNALAEAWDSLTTNPKRNDQTCHPLKGDLSEVTVRGEKLVRRQYELPGGARIWYAVTDGKPGTVHLLNVHTHHPNQTK